MGKFILGIAAGILFGSWYLDYQNGDRVWNPAGNTYCSATGDTIWWRLVRDADFEMRVGGKIERAELGMLAVGERLVLVPSGSRDRVVILNDTGNVVYTARDTKTFYTLCTR